MRSHPLAIASRFSPISLEEMDLKAALQTRLDNKYYVTRCVFEEFAQALQSTHAVLDIEGDRVFGYDTVYFDTDALELYQAHIQQRRKRFKVRTRYYRESALCFFEVKLKGGRGETIKKKIECEHANVLRITAEARDFIRGQVGTYYGRDFTQPLRPSLSTTYRRMTLVANETQERITCDFDLAFAGIAGIAGIAGTGGRTARMRARLWRFGQAHVAPGCPAGGWQQVLSRDQPPPSGNEEQRRAAALGEVFWLAELRRRSVQ
jgi:hypothetical protein